MLRILSLGAGVQSSTLALMIEHGEVKPVEAAIFADTLNEPPLVYEWLDWLEKQLSFPVYRVSNGDLKEAALRIRISKKKRNYAKSTVPAYIIDSESKVGIMMRQCTVDFKINVIRRQIRKLLKGKPLKATQLIAFSLDEASRIKEPNVQYLKNEYPLIELRMKRTDCLKWMREHGYPEPPRSACVFCPFHNDKEWQRLKIQEPEEFQKAVEFEKAYQRTYSQIYNFRGTPYLHSSLKPLDQVDFEKGNGQLDLFNNECDGVCGV